MRNRGSDKALSCPCILWSSLGVIAAPKGRVAGAIHLKSNGRWIDCLQLDSDGFPISGDIDIVLNMGVYTSSRYCLVVEKEATFQGLPGNVDAWHRRLVGYNMSRLHETLSRGMRLPRLILSKIVILRNPYGLSILSTYKFGSDSMACESQEYLVDICWLGVRKRHLLQLEEVNFPHLSN